MQTEKSLIVQKWLNTDNDLSIRMLHGKVVMVLAFQMLCPGCVEHAIPQARRVYAMFSPDDVAVIGLHTVFEHHTVMGEDALKVFIKEYQIDFPVGIDTPSNDIFDPLPKTMCAYKMGGTPTLLLFDKQGRYRKQKMGIEHDLVLGAELMSLVMEDETKKDASQDRSDFSDTAERNFENRY